MDNKELIMFLLMNIMSADDDYIESNEIEILGEDVNGVEGFCTYKITDAAKLAYDEITTLRQQVKDMEWISVDDRLPDVGHMVLVYSPPTKESWPNEVNIGFDYIDEDYKYWYNHSENYEHYCAAALPEGSIGPSEKASYTHWMPLPKPPMKQHNEGEN